MNSGCAVKMAATAPDRKDLSVLTPGISRSQVVAELGPPAQSRQEPQGDIDVFAFKQGYSTPAKVSRALAHGAADVATAGLWEVVGTPIESSLQGEDVRAEVTYDTNDLVHRVEYYSGAHLANGGPALASWMRGSSTSQTAVIGTDPVPPQDTGIVVTGAGEAGQ